MTVYSKLLTHLSNHSGGYTQFPLSKISSLATNQALWYVTLLVTNVSYAERINHMFTPYIPNPTNHHYNCNLWEPMYLCHYLHNMRWIYYHGYSYRSDRSYSLYFLQFICSSCDIPVLRANSFAAYPLLNSITIQYSGVDIEEGAFSDIAHNWIT